MHNTHFGTVQLSSARNQNSIPCLYSTMWQCVTGYGKVRHVEHNKLWTEQSAYCKAVLGRMWSKLCRCQLSILEQHPRSASRQPRMIKGDLVNRMYDMQKPDAPVGPYLPQEWYCWGVDSI